MRPYNFVAIYTICYDNNQASFTRKKYSVLSNLMKPTIYTSRFSTRHDTGHGHPESPARIEMLEKLFAAAPFKDWPQKQSKPADLDQIMLAHDEDYIFDLQDKTPDHGLVSIDGDTILSPDSYNAALHAAGAVCQAVDDILDDGCAECPPACGHDDIKRAFCATRPPGHHAEPDKAMGFCFFNNIFIAARHAQEQYSIKKITLIDFDVHHGNGTETMCRTHNKNHPEKPILYISSHGHPLFPMSGDPTKNDKTTLNIHLPDGCTSDQFRKLYDTQVFPELNDFKPELLMLSSGFDAHRLDPLAPMMLETEDFSWVTQKLCELADKHAQGRVISVLEGGYELESLKECVHAHLIALEK